MYGVWWSFMCQCATLGGMPNTRVAPGPACRPAAQTKPGSATLPFFGVVPVLKDAHTGATLEGNDVSVCPRAAWCAARVLVLWPTIGGVRTT